MRHRIRRALGTLLATGLLGTGLVALEVPAAQAAYPVPPTPAGLPAAIEVLQPYVGQSTCDPVAKAGVTAFRDLLLRTYTDSGSLGIVRACSAGGQSEHKEGRAFDWAMSAGNARQKAEVATLLGWLFRTDANGNQYAMVRRFGIMYIIWDHHIWKAYDAAAGWQAYDGPNPHTDHVHFSFGWNGALKTTSYWDKTVAPISFGPNGPPHITPVRAVANIATVRQYGGTTQAMHSSGAAVSVIQRALKVSPVDGSFGSDTGTHVMKLQVDYQLPITGRFGPAEWKLLFPYPIAPFGKVDPPSYVLGNAVVTGWALDADTTDPVDVAASVDGAAPQRISAVVPRSDVNSAYPEWGAAHGFSFVLPVTDGSHQVCLTAFNATGTPGTDTALGCSTVTAQHNPIGAVSSLVPALGQVSFAGWALDPDSADALSTALTVDGAPSDAVLTTVSQTGLAARYPGLGDAHGVTGTLTLPEGTHTVCLTAANAAGTPGADATVGCRSVVVQHSPVGGIEVLRRTPGGVTVRGWALDPDVTDPATVEVVSDGVVAAAVPAATPRTGLPAVYAPTGTAHGFTTVVNLPEGRHVVCARAVNAATTPGAATTQLACSTIVVSHSPSALLTALRTVPGGSVVASGDAYDPDTLNPIAVTVLVDGKPAATSTANRTSTTSATRWLGYGPARGFSSTLAVAAGRHTVCVRAENAVGTPGTPLALPCRVLVVHDTTGALVSLARSWRTVTVRGWAIDPDTASAAQASLLVDGSVFATTTAKGYRSDIATALPGYGSYHGYVLVRTLTPGTHRVCVLARNVRGTLGTSRTVGCRTVTVP